MATLSSNQLQSSHFRHVEIPAIRILAGEASKSVKTQDESPSPREASNNEETSPSEQESDFEEGLEGEQISIHNDHENLNSNPNPNPNSHPSNRNLQIKIALRIRTNINRRNKRVGKALDEFRFRLENALQGSYLLGHSHKDENPRKVGQNLKDITLWGVPLLPSKGHEGTNVILLKFLKAQDYKAPEALEMLRQTLIWRDKQGIDRILEEKLEDQTENELNKVVFMDNVDKDGHPLCFNLYGAFKDRELYSRTFGTEKKREEFLRWRVQLMEKSIRKLNFEEGGVNSFLFISDMKNAPRPGSRMKELSQISKDAVCLFQRHYPELIYKHIIVNTPLWCYLYHSLISQYCTHGTRKKFVFARPYRVTETLLRYIPPQNIPIQYGGLRREDDEDFTTQDEPQEFSLRPGAVSTFQISMSEVKVSIVWEVMVVGWDVTYKDEFIPNDEGSYKILLQKKKINGETVRHSFYINEPGKILITIKNTTYIKKRAFIRYKTKVILPVYMCTPE